MEYIRHQLIDLYRGVYDGIADGITIENENLVYIVDSGKQDGKITFGVRRKRSIKNPQLRQDFIRSTNDESISKGYVSDELSARIRDGIGSNFGRNLRRELGEELQVDTGKSSNNQNGISQKNGDNRGLGKVLRELDAVTRGDM